ncbi:MAG: class I SAM-dependent methyltransferase [Clostridia bacterium]|nr:class I SAM-dependent methyltransferase [Clostridia bacterium]MDE7328784.1 class I SAM-dependent methyltransferase [Clostridia bacterium]
MKVASEWKDYRIIATGEGQKLERWGSLVLLRPDPQIIWKSSRSLDNDKSINAKYIRSNQGGGRWEFKGGAPDEFTVERKGLVFSLKLMGFKHTGLFPEQAVNWDIMQELIRGSGRKIKVLNLFAYTGGATVACAKAGANVTHVDAAKAMVERAKTNARLSGIEQDRIRYIVDDCQKFIAREIRRGNKYDAIIMDPPSYGRGANGEVWKLEDCIFDLVKECTKVLSDEPLFFLINSYTTGLQPQVIDNILRLNLNGFDGESEAYEVGLPTDEGIILPCGCSGLWIGKKTKKK